MSSSSAPPNVGLQPKPRQLWLLWLLSVPLFGVAYALAWGWAPVAVAYWSTLVAPLAFLTVERNTRRRNARHLVILSTLILGWIFVICCAAASIFADAWLAPYDMLAQRSALIFAGLLASWGMYISISRQAR